MVLNVANATMKQAVLQVNGSTFNLALVQPLPLKPYLYSRSYLSDSSKVTTFDELRISRVDPCPTLKCFSYWGANWATGGNHLSEVASANDSIGYTNLNMIGFANASELDNCALASCVICAGYYLLQGGAQKTLRPDYKVSYDLLIVTIGTRLNKTAAICIIDEPNGYYISASDLQAAVSYAKQKTPSIPTMIVYAPWKPWRPWPTPFVPSNADWLGFDQYWSPSVEPLLSSLEGTLSDQQRTFLLPESFLDGHPDSDLAQRQYWYFDISRRHPKVIGLMSWGVWVSDGQPQLTTLPATADAQQRIGNEIQLN